MGKRKSRRGKEKEPTIMLPVANDILGIVVKILGGERLMARCQDGKNRLCRVRGKMKRRIWIKQNDIVLVSPWDFQSESRGDIIYRYTRGQIKWLRRNGYLEWLPDENA